MLVEGIVGVQKEVVLAAVRSVVTVEEVVDLLDPPSLNSVVLPTWTIDMVAVVPGGAAPSYAHGYDRRDNAFYLAWDGISRHRDGFLGWMEERRARNMSTEPDEMMTIVAAPALADDDVCFVGIGAPSAACNLARLTHAPRITLIYESGTIGTKPEVLPLDRRRGTGGNLADHRLRSRDVPLLAPGRPDLGRVSRRGAVGPIRQHQHHCDRRLPPTKGAAPRGRRAPEIATSCSQVFVTMRHTAKSMVERVDFVTSLGFGPTGVERTALGVSTRGPTLVITDLCTLTPDAENNELVVSALHPGVGRSDVEAATGWDVRFSADLGETEAPTNEELSVLRLLHERTEQAHRGGPG